MSFPAWRADRRPQLGLFLSACKKSCVRPYRTKFHHYASVTLQSVLSLVATRDSGKILPRNGTSITNFANRKRIIA